MSKDQIRHLIDQRLPEAGVIDTALKGVQLFRVTEPVPCAPAVYEPTVVAILSGVKEAILDGEHHAYGSEEYLLCPMTLPVEAGAPQAPDSDTTACRSQRWRWRNGIPDLLRPCCGCWSCSIIRWTRRCWARGVCASCIMPC